MTMPTIYMGGILSAEMMHEEEAAATELKWRLLCKGWREDGTMPCKPL